MKTQFAILSITASALLATAAQADDYCQARQELEARITLAKLRNTKAQNVKVVNFEPGIWTMAMGDNVGSDSVTVSLQERNRLIQKKFEVAAKQIGPSADCKITGIEEEGQ